MISKVLSVKLQKVLPDLPCSQQTAYVKSRHTGESGILIFVIEISKIEKLKSFLITMNIEKGFDSLNHDFLLATL